MAAKSKIVPPTSQHRIVSYRVGLAFPNWTRCRTFLDIYHRLPVWISATLKLPNLARLVPKARNVKARDGSPGSACESEKRVPKGRHVMAHTYPNVLLHCVFSTKNRMDSIPDDLREKLSMYFVGIGKGHNIPVLCAGGTRNHVHLMIALPATVPLAKAIQVLKANSSRWLGEHGFDFAWQEGYGAFSVSASNAGVVRHYIEHQDEHHAKHSFEDEFVSLLRKSNVAYNPQFVFG